MAITQISAVNISQPASATHEALAAPLAAETVPWILLARSGVPFAAPARLRIHPLPWALVLCIYPVAMLTSGIRWISCARQHMCVSLGSTIAGKHTERRHKYFSAIMATETVGRIHLALHRVRISGAGVLKDLPTEANVPRTFLTSHFMRIALRSAITGDTPHHSISRDIQPLTKRAFKSIHWVGGTSRRVSFSHGWVREHPAAKALVFRILLAGDLVGVALRPTIDAAEAKHVVGLHKVRFAELAVVMVCRVHVARNSVSVPSLRVGKKIAAKASIRGVVLATHCVSIPKGFAIRC